MTVSPPRTPRSRLSLVILPFQDASMATATLHDTDKRSPHRVARTRRGIPIFVREARGLEPLSSSICRRILAASSSSSPLRSSPVVRRNETIPITDDVAWRPLVALGFGQRPPRCFAVHAAEGRPSVLAMTRTSQGSPRTTLVRVEDGRRDGSSRTIGIERNEGSRRFFF